MTGYEPMTAELVVCTTCGCVVGFAYMTAHTRWHELMEPAWPLAKLPKKGLQNQPSLGE